MGRHGRTVSSILYKNFNLVLCEDEFSEVSEGLVGIVLWVQRVVSGSPTELYPGPTETLEEGKAPGSV